MRRAFILAIPILAIVVSVWSGTVLKAQGNTPTRGRVAGGSGAAAKIATGTVKSVTATMLTIEGAQGPLKVMSLAVNAATKVSGMGVAPKVKAAGGKTVITDLVASGDRVSVSYTGEGTTMMAASVRVTAKGPK